MYINGRCKIYLLSKFMILFILIHSLFAKFINDRSIKGSIIANWTETPLISEALAFFQDVDHSAFWDSIDALSNEAEIPSTIDSVLSFAKSFIDDELISLLNFSLSIRYYSPRIEYFRSFAHEKKKDFFILCRNSIIDEIPSDIQKEFSSCDTQFQNYEPVFGNGNISIAFYIDMTSNKKKEWGQFLHDLQKYDDAIKFVVRPIGYSEDPMILSGYGVQMKPFKYSMEFKVNDETKQIKPTQKDFIKKDFSKYGLKTDAELKLDDNLNFNLDQLPFQFSVFAKNTSDPVNTIRELTTNFPLFAKQINKIKVSDSIMRNFNRNPQFASPGQSTLFINGRRLPEDELNFYSIYKAMLEEYKTNKILEDIFELDNNSIRIFKKTGNANRKKIQIPMVDARSDLFVYWMNDLETDEKYVNKLPNSLLAFANEKVSFPAISRNIANAIFILDPTDINCLDTLSIIQDLIDQQFPVRFGYTIAPIKRSPTAKKIYYAYVHLALKYGMKAAHKFLTKVNDMRGFFDEKTGKLGPVKQNSWANAFGSIAINRRSPSFKTINDLFKPKTDESRFIQRLNEHIKNIGVSVPSMILNGKIVEENHPEHYLKTILEDEARNIRELISNHKIKDTTTDFHDFFLSQKGVFKRYNRLIQTGKTEFAETIRIQTESIQNQRSFSKWMKTINYQYGTSSGIKMQSFWIFNNVQDDGNDTLHVKREVERFMSEVANIDETRLAYFEGNSIVIPEIVSKIINVPNGKVTVVFNGRIVRFEAKKFSRFDLQLLQEWEKVFSTDFSKSYNDRSAKKRTLSVSRPIREISDSLLYMSMVASSLSHQGSPRTGQPYKTFKNRAVNVYRSPKNSSKLNVHLLIDPFNINGQRLSCILPVMKSFSFCLMLNPQIQLSKGQNDLDSLFSFYSKFESNGFSFSYLNQSTTYSVIPDVPHSWHIYRESADFDLDNVIVDQLQKGTHECLFRLSSILIEGCIVDVNGKNKLNEIEEGIELKLFQSNGKKKDETRCITRNGYFQLKSSPAQYKITTNTDESFQVSCDSYFPRFNFEYCFKDVKSYSNKNSTFSDNRVHIFIVASGHLYERLERIMILSAIRHTKHVVKFWILENFVSPQHRRILPIISKRYSFEYEFCSYNWPTWIHKESQRQRLFWGYKILFLDLMFPNDLKRVIYVDADDVIRTDYYELMQIDMKGAPYAFTPFCEDRPEMEEYRFWNDGYWRDLLNGKRYHISAMFVIDLEQFRRRHTGDLIRKAYSDLWSDKQSLANLDQDIPNLLQTKGAEIFSLPQEWLWCGSWCSDDSMAKAKTIDLCNNPRTKESKIEYAKKTMPDWIKLDQEINSEFVKDEL